MLANMPPVNGKVKGLLKGLRYISQIFEETEKEKELVIGNPTDVKHVAHIGWDGPQVTSPAWMNEYHSAPLSNTGGIDGRDGISPRSSFQEIPLGGIPPPSPSRDDLSPKHRRGRRHASSEAPGSESPARARGTRHSRKHQSAGSAPGSESPSRDGESSRRGRRHHKSDKPDKYEISDGHIGSGFESPARDFPSIPKDKKKKERRSKGSKDRHVSDSGAEGRIAAPVRGEVTY